MRRFTTTTTTGSALAAAALAAALIAGGAGCRAAPEPRPPAPPRQQPRAAGNSAATAGETPFVRSEGSEDCGAAALASALVMAGAARPFEVVRDAIVDRGRGGTPTSSLVRFARAQDVFALSRSSWALDDLKAWVRAGVAPIVLLAVGPVEAGRFHYVLLRGYDDARRILMVQDGRDAEQEVPYDDFFPRWCAARTFALVVCAATIRLPPGEALLNARELGALGWLAERRGELEAARRHYLAALARDPKFFAASRNLANIERKLGRY